MLNVACRCVHSESTAWANAAIFNFLFFPASIWCLKRLVTLWTLTYSSQYFHLVDFYVPSEYCLASVVVLPPNSLVHDDTWMLHSFVIQNLPCLLMRQQHSGHTVKQKATWRIQFVWSTRTGTVFGSLKTILQNGGISVHWFPAARYYSCLHCRIVTPRVEMEAGKDGEWRIIIWFDLCRAQFPGCTSEAEALPSYYRWAIFQECNAYKWNCRGSFSGFR